MPCWRDAETHLYLSLPRQNQQLLKKHLSSSGTCWICASSCTMMTSYQLDHDEKIMFDQLDLLNAVYNDDNEEGVFVSEGTDKEAFGGSGIFVVNELANGFIDGLVLDNAISAQNWTMEEVKDGIKQYGALYIGIPDPQTKKGTYDNYYTMNCPSPTDGEFDQVNDTPLFMSLTKDYSKVASYDCGRWLTEPVSTRASTTTANVFKEKGTLAAVGTYGS